MTIGSVSQLWGKFSRIAHSFTSAPLKTVKRSLPKPPVPDLNHTLHRYLEYAGVVAAGQDRSLRATYAAVEQFRSQGERFQKELVQIAVKKKNWINSFWLPEMYLRVRLPLPVNSSPAYVFPQQTFSDMNEWLRYAALLVRGILEFKDKIDRKDIEREMSTGNNKVHLCMEQYEKILSCYREPGIVEDIQIKKPKRNMLNEHVLVMYNNQTFVVHTRLGGNLLPFADIFHQLKEVQHRAKARQRDLVIPVGGASTGDRTTAAEFWLEMNSLEINKKSLEWAKDALFVVCLDEDHEQINMKNTEAALVARGKHLLTGNGKYGFNRWYDATIQLIVSLNGTNGLCIEHSTAEGIVIIHMAESALRFARENWKRKMICREERQICPKSLTWHMSNKALQLLEKQKITFNELVNELDLEVLIFKDFGKDFIKSCGISPDGFVQLALQLAYFKLHGRLVSTYESASLRRYGRGRVDNIRANTQEALEWVTAMKKDSLSRDSKVLLFRKAADKQAKVTAENLTGEGIDNHLCALFVLAREAVRKRELDAMPTLFEDPLWNDLLRFPLSTSQVTTSPDISDTYLCYGAVVRDGYGCSYNIQRDHIVLAPASFCSNPHTNLYGFKKSIYDAMIEMKNLLKTS